MNRIQRILNHPLWKECMQQNAEAEKSRRFCHHDMEHACAVGRIAMLLNLEQQCKLQKDLIYAAAFLHDCGRYQQYRDHIAHETAGAAIAAQILPECGYEEAEITQILEAIQSHRGNNSGAQKSTLGQLLYRADKLSRNCCMCEAYTECNWTKEAKEQPFLW